MSIEVYRQHQTVVEWNRAQTDPFALKGDGRYLTAHEMYNAITRFREHTFFRAITRLNGQSFACYIFAEDGYGERRFELVFFAQRDQSGEQPDRWEVSVRFAYLAFQVLGLNHFPIDVKWECIPLPEGSMP